MSNEKKETKDRHMGNEETSKKERKNQRSVGEKERGK
jgi:hypothetical protein